MHVGQSGFTPVTEFTDSPPMVMLNLSKTAAAQFEIPVAKQLLKKELYRWLRA